MPPLASVTEDKDEGVVPLHIDWLALIEPGENEPIIVATTGVRLVDKQPYVLSLACA